MSIPRVLIAGLRGGSGKTIISLGLLAAWKTRFPKLPGIYATAIDFARELADAIQTQTTEEFGIRYRRAALFVLEDVDSLTGRRAAQRELIFTLDSLRTTGARVVLTAKRPPAELPGIASGLQSRLVGGLVVPLLPPGRNARLVILKRLARQQSVTLTDGAACILATAMNVTVPELCGAVKQLQMSARKQGGVIDAAVARSYLADHNGTRRLSLHNLALLTARYFSLKLADLQSASRRHAVVTARGVAMYLARSLTAESFEQIGRYFGGRDHSTVAYGCRRTEQRLKTEPEVRRAVLELQERCLAELPLPEGE